VHGHRERRIYIYIYIYVCVCVDGKNRDRWCILYNIVAGRMCRYRRVQYIHIVIVSNQSCRWYIYIYIYLFYYILYCAYWTVGIIIIIIIMCFRPMIYTFIYNNMCALVVSVCTDALLGESTTFVRCPFSIRAGKTVYSTRGKYASRSPAGRRATGAADDARFTPSRKWISVNTPWHRRFVFINDVTAIYIDIYIYIH